MIRNAWKLIILLSVGAAACSAQTLSASWEELTSADFVKAIEKAGGVCALPLGSLEKSGPSQPLGTATYIARIVTLEAVKQEYAVVFPEYIVSRVSGSRILPGAVAYSNHLQLEMLQETVHEMARNGCVKILIVNAQSGNSGLISEFMNADLSQPHEYVVYSVFGGPPRMTPPTEFTKKLPQAMQPSGPDVDGHGGEDRTSVLMAFYPSLAHPERAHDEPIQSHEVVRVLPAGVQTAISQFPTGYNGDSTHATAERGKAMVAYQANLVVNALRAIKADNVVPRVQKEYFEKLSAGK